ncbi:MAG: DUF1513 domain-containing protein [Pseudomonadota bacterium]
MTYRLDRRRFLASVAGASALSGYGWAAAGAPDYLAATRRPDGRYALVGLGADGAIFFDIDLPARGHAAAAHPKRAEAVAFARRPGSFAIVIDCVTGHTLFTLAAPLGRHFYGHGAFSADGRLLFTTENAFETGDGRLGIWDAAGGYARLGDVSSGGVGPHDMVLLPGGKTLAVANGGIRTHPKSGREKLNLPSMRPNLAYLCVDTAAVAEIIEPPDTLRLNSIRHLAVRADGTVAVALQWQGDPSDGVPLLAFSRPGDPDLRFCYASRPMLTAMRGYAGSVAFSGSGRQAAITSPRGGRVMAWQVAGSAPTVWHRQDVCGIAGRAQGWLATDGLGGMAVLDETLLPTAAKRQAGAFDNHLVSLLHNT